MTTREAAANCLGPVRSVERRWLDALLGEPTAGAAIAREAAGAMLALEERRWAAEAYLDAALLAERAGRDGSADRSAAAELLAACGMAPMLP